jgi:hypothetical protein
MSWSVGVSSLPPDELFDALDDRFDANYPEPAEGVKDQFEAAKVCVDTLLHVVDGSLYNCSLSGHKQHEDAPDSLSISLNSVATT